MPLFSEEISKKSPSIQRHLYDAFRTAVGAGEIEALKLLTKFQIPKVRDGYKDVFDYAYTSSTQITVSAWITANEQLPRSGTTAEQVKNMTDEQLATLIKEQQKPTKKPVKRTTRTKAKARPKTTKKAEPGQTAKSTKAPAPSKDAPKAPETEAVKATTTGPLSESTMQQLRERTKSKE